MKSSLIDGQDEPIAGINVVPLVDIILVVLIIFMVTAPLVLKPTIDVNLPEASSGQKDQVTQPIEVIINGVGDIFLNSQKVSLNQFKESIQVQAKTKNSSVILTADKEVTLNKLTAIIDIIKNSGIKKVGFSVQKK